MKYNYKDVKECVLVLAPRTDNSELDVRSVFPTDLPHYYLTLPWCATLILANEWNITVIRRGWGGFKNITSL